jgi:hypothetical protein
MVSYISRRYHVTEGVMAKMERRNLREIEFGPEARSYFRECLGHGSSYAQALARGVPEGGRIFSYLPARFLAVANQPFEYGGVITTRSEGQERDSRLVEFIVHGLARGSAAYAVFETLYGVTDPAFKKVELPYFSHRQGAEVYLSLGANQREARFVMDAIRHARYYPFIAGLTASDEGGSPVCGEEVGEDVLERLASRTTHILTDIYDGEAYLIWDLGSQQ